MSGSFKHYGYQFGDAAGRTNEIINNLKPHSKLNNHKHADKILHEANLFMNKDIPSQTQKKVAIATPHDHSEFVQGVDDMLRNNFSKEHLKDYLNNYETNSNHEFSRINTDGNGRYFSHPK